MIRQDLLGIAGRVLRDPVEAEDVVQEAFVRLHAASEPIERPDHWLRRVTKRIAIDHLRRRKDQVEQELMAEANDPDATGVVAAWLPLFVQGLDEPYRTAIQRVDLDGISQAAFAEEAGMSLSGARSRVQRGRKLLHESVLACCAVRFEDGVVVDTGARCSC